MRCLSDVLLGVALGALALLVASAAVEWWRVRRDRERGPGDGE